MDAEIMKKWCKKVFLSNPAKPEGGKYCEMPNQTMNTASLGNEVNYRPILEILAFHSLRYQKNRCMRPDIRPRAGFWYLCYRNLL